MTEDSLNGDGFIPKVVDEFGLKWTQIAALSGLVFSLFGLDQWFNSGAWTVAAIAALGSVYALRRFITLPLPIVILVSVGTLAAYLVGLWWITGQPDVVAWLATNKLLGSLLLGYGVMSAAAVVVLSYRRQESLYGGPYPASVARAVSKLLVEQPFYREDQKYVLEFLSSDAGRTVIKLRLTYVLVNRTGHSLATHLFLTPMRPRVEFLEARAGSTTYDVSDVRIRNDAGLQIPVTVKPRERLAVILSARVDYWPSDSDLFATYVPATRLELEVRNSLPGIDVHVETLSTPSVVPSGGKAGVRRWVLADGLMPYQGFKVDWVRAP